MQPEPWFLKELALIDRDLFVTWDRHYEYWVVKKRFRKVIKRGNYLIEFKDPTIAIYKELNNNALDNLRYRYWLGNKLTGERYLKWIFDQAKEASEKRKQIANEMIAEGIMKAYKIATTKTFDMHVGRSADGQQKGELNDAGRNKTSS